MRLKPDDYGLIVALDIEDENYLLEVVKSTKDYVSAYKIGWPAVLSLGMEIISKITKYAPVICDFKIADIPEISEIIARKAFERGATGIIVHSFVGEYTLKRVVDVARSYNGMTFALVYMTHKGVESVFSKVYEVLVDIVKKVNIDGIVAPATRPHIIKDLRKTFNDKIIISPGVGAQGGDVVETLEAGANYIIVGRAIYSAYNPEDAAKSFYEKILSWRNSKL